MITYYINNKMILYRPNSDPLPRVGDSVHLIKEIGTKTFDKMVEVEQILYIIKNDSNDHVVEIKVFCK